MSGMPSSPGNAGHALDEDGVNASAKAVFENATPGAKVESTVLPERGRPGDVRNTDETRTEPSRCFCRLTVRRPR
jgi:hypothetical protein